MRSSGCSAKNSLSGSEGSADFRLSVHYSSTILALSCHNLEAEVGIALRHCFVPILTTPMQINQLRSFPSKIRVPEVFAKIKNYPAKILSSSLHSSASIHLPELLLEVCSSSRSLLPHRAPSPRSCRTIGPERSGLQAWKHGSRARRDRHASARGRRVGIPGQFHSNTQTESTEPSFKDAIL